MRSAKEAGCFPYSSKLVCYIEVFSNGETRQLAHAGEKIEAYCNARDGKSKIIAVWPGKWRSDMFIIDDLEEFCEKQKLFAGGYA